uniref:Uncharacterized protein n=1 Tax=Anguilla anguilla TaxID=7936 RepID=A0A0E9VKM9_ANGAN
MFKYKGKINLSLIYTTRPQVHHLACSGPYETSRENL